MNFKLNIIKLNNFTIYHNLQLNDDVENVLHGYIIIKFESLKVLVPFTIFLGPIQQQYLSIFQLLAQNFHHMASYFFFSSPYGFSFYYIFCKFSLVLVYVSFVPLMILYLMYVGSRWLGGDLCLQRLRGLAYRDVKMCLCPLFFLSILYSVDQLSLGNLSLQSCIYLYACSEEL